MAKENGAQNQPLADFLLELEYMPIGRGYCLRQKMNSAKSAFS